MTPQNDRKDWMPLFSPNKVHIPKLRKLDIRITKYAKNLGVLNLHRTLQSYDAEDLNALIPPTPSFENLSSSLKAHHFQLALGAG
jgi:hypothetical protein